MKAIDLRDAAFDLLKYVDAASNGEQLLSRETASLLQCSSR
jgi:hypothetical protein